MEKENEGLNVDDFLGDDVGVAETETQEEKQQEKQQEEQQKEQEEKRGTETKEQGTESSNITDLLDDDETTSKETDNRRVPLEQVIKLRKRAQAAEAERDALKEKITQPAAENAETDPLKDLDDNDYLTAGQVKKLLETNTSRIQKTAKAEAERSAQLARAERIIERSIISEKEFKTKTEDYDKITKVASELKLFTDADRQKIFDSENPAQTYYEMAKNKLGTIRSVFGGSTDKPKTTKTKSEIPNTENENEDDDEKIFEEVFGSSG